MYSKFDPIYDSIDTAAEQRERAAIAEADAEAAHAAFLEAEALECAIADAIAAPVFAALNGWRKAVTMQEAA
jgi:hypothetical protein